jgi:hypothetical protein
MTALAIVGFMLGSVALAFLFLFGFYKVIEKVLNSDDIKSKKVRRPK